MKQNKLFFKIIAFKIVYNCLGHLGIWVALPLRSPSFSWSPCVNSKIFVLRLSSCCDHMTGWELTHDSKVFSGPQMQPGCRFMICPSIMCFFGKIYFTRWGLPLWN